VREKEDTKITKCHFEDEDVVQRDVSSVKLAGMR
jgi:hypothetical protein